MRDAKEDKATVPIYYESRLAKLDINCEEIDRLNIFGVIFEVRRF